MNGHVFQCFNECEDKQQFSKTVEALGEYIAKKLKYPGDMASLTKDFVRPEIPKPTELKVSETNRHVAKLKERTRLEHFIERSDALLSNSSNKFWPRISSETSPLPLMTPNGLYSSTVPR